MREYNYKKVLGFHIFNGTSQQLVSYIDSHLGESHKPLCFFYANSNLMQHCYRKSELFDAPDILFANDGIALDLAAKYVTGEKFKENLNGTDFSPFLLQHSSSIKKIFLLGGGSGIAEAAAAKLSMIPNVEIAGFADGFSDLSNKDELIKKINFCKPDMLFVALGNPKQEYWLLENRHLLDVKIVSGVGALFDFLSGNVKRAPNWIQKLRCEWLYRLIGEPRRLLRRYSIEMFYFFYLVYKNHK